MEVYEKVGSPAQLCGARSPIYKIYESTSELVQNISISLIEVYEKIGSPAH